KRGKVGGVGGGLCAAARGGRRAQAELRKAIDDRLQFESMIADITSHFVNIDDALIDGAIRDAQGRLAAALDIDRSQLYVVTGDGFVLTHFWSRTETASIGGISSALDRLP